MPKAPATMLRDLVQEEVATITSLGRSQALSSFSMLRFVCHLIQAKRRLVRVVSLFREVFDLHGQ